MEFRLALEIGSDEWCMAWVVDLPGCFVNRPSRQAAIADAPEAIRADLRWLENHGENVEAQERITSSVEEIVERRGTAADGMTQAFFTSDTEAVTQQQLEVLLRRLNDSRLDLLAILESVPGDAWNWKRPEREQRVSGYYPTVKEQAQHVAAIERWYIKKLWPVPRFSPARNVLDRLERVREFVVQTLADRAVQDSEAVVTVGSEKWTSRKILRRLLCHERYHMRQIEAILEQYANGASS